MTGLGKSTLKSFNRKRVAAKAKVKLAFSLDCVGGGGELTWQRIC
jgi:hypothetical protein